MGAHYGGIVSGDRYGGYSAYNRQRQICWARLKRGFQALIDAGVKAK
jgi:hypothetical protein